MERDRAEQILALVRVIPEGFVSTYGDLCPQAPRLSGAVLGSALAAEVPWHRVVRADGSLARGRRQRRLLEREGVPFHGERVDLEEARIPPEALALELRHTGVQPKLPPGQGTPA